MYASFFGLKREPFSIAPDPRYLFMSERHREALAHLLYGVGGGGGFVLLTGEIGAGKTTVCRCFLEQIPRRCNVAYIFNPKLTVLELLQSVCEEFRIPLDGLDSSAATVKEYLDRLNEFLLRTHSVGQNNVLIIDEAQNLSPDVLEQLRLLTNLETSERKLLQIILIGQPELRDMLAQPQLEQLAQRVIARFHLDALTAAETAQYIEHRLGVAGLKAGTLFDKQATQRVHELTRGVPRRINLLCDRALLGAYASGKSTVTADIVDKAAGEVFESHAGGTVPRVRHYMLTHRHAGRWLAAGALLLGAVGLAAWAALSGPLSSKRMSPTSKQVAASAPVTTKASEPVASAASMPSPTPSGANQAKPLATLATPFDWAHGFDQALRDEPAAWHELAPLWALAPLDGDPCKQAASQQVYCFKTNGGLGLIQQLGRPGIVTLFDAQGHVAYGLLTALNSHDATLKFGDKTQTITLTDLSRIWRGEFATFWRAPAGFKGKMGDGQSGPVVEWLDQSLAKIQGDPAPTTPSKLDAKLKARVYAFQLAHGLTPDGVPGPTTFMQINRAIGVNEPRLITRAPSESNSEK